MTTPDFSSQIEMALLESPAVAEVLAVRVAGGDAADLIGVRVSVLGASAAGDLLPIVATLRARIREIAPSAEIFIEADPTVARGHDLSTEAIVIRSLD